MPKVLIPIVYRGPTSGAAEVPVEGTTVLECIQAVEKQYPGFEPMVIDDDGVLQRFVQIFVNREQLAAADALSQAVAAGDEVDVVAAVAGG